MFVNTTDMSQTKALKLLQKSLGIQQLYGLGFPEDGFVYGYKSEKASGEAQKNKDGTSNKFHRVLKPVVKKMNTGSRNERISRLLGVDMDSIKENKSTLNRDAMDGDSIDG